MPLELYCPPYPPPVPDDDAYPLFPYAPSYVDGNNADPPREYDVSGLAAPRVNGQRLDPTPLPVVGDGGLPDRMVSDRRAEMAAVVLFGVTGDDAKYVDVGLDGDARGMMSLGSR
jgi:hypothetical protein